MFIAAAPAQAQSPTPSKAEQKQYDKIIAKPSLKAYNKFLSAYPQSVYAPQITALRDSVVFAKVKKNDAVALEDFIAANPQSVCVPQAESLLKVLNKPVTDPEQAKKIAAEMYGKPCGSELCILQYRRRNLDYIVVFDVMPEGLPFEQVKISTFVESGKGNFKEEFTNVIPKYVMNPGSDKSVIAEEPQLVFIGGTRQFLFTYLNHSTNAEEVTLEYVANLVSTDLEYCTNAIFYGMNLDGKAPDAYGAYRIDGRSPETMAQGGLSHEQAFINQLLSDNKGLQQISEADALSDDAVVWWLEKNPEARTSASSLNFGSIPDESSLVSEFKRVRKESSKTYSAAVMDFRGHTVIVSYNKSTKKYSLVWVEPICRNRKTDRFLADIYFESNGTTLDLFYYKGKTTFKYHINLASKTIRR